MSGVLFLFFVGCLGVYTKEAKKWSDEDRAIQEIGESDE